MFFYILCYVSNYKFFDFIVVLFNFNNKTKETKLHSGLPQLITRKLDTQYFLSLSADIHIESSIAVCVLQSSANQLSVISCRPWASDRPKFSLSIFIFLKLFNLVTCL